MSVLRRKFVPIVLAAALLVPLASCKGKGLTRNRAASIIANSNTKGVMLLRQNAKIHDYNKFIELGKAQGIFIKQRIISFGQAEWRIVRGERLLRFAKPLLVRTLLDSYISFVTPVSLQIEPTGISGYGSDDNRKVVEFTWNQVDVPGVIKQFAVTRGAGRAILQRYDDGWRVKDIKVSFAKNLSALSDAERSKIEEDIRTETARVQKISEKQRRAGELQRQRIKKCVIAHRDIKQFNSTTSNWSGRTSVQLTVTDASLRVRSTSDRGKAHRFEVPFFHIRRIGHRTALMYVDLYCAKPQNLQGGSDDIWISFSPDSFRQVQPILNAALVAWRKQCSDIYPPKKWNRRAHCQHIR